VNETVPPVVEATVEAASAADALELANTREYIKPGRALRSTLAVAKVVPSDVLDPDVTRWATTEQVANWRWLTVPADSVRGEDTTQSRTFEPSTA
jgi:hypothetical protein